MDKFYLVLSVKMVCALAVSLIQEGHTLEAAAVLDYIVMGKERQEFFGSVLLPTGAKFGRVTGSTKYGSYCIFGYSQTASDVIPYQPFGKRIFY